MKNYLKKIWIIALLLEVQSLSPIALPFFVEKKIRNQTEPVRLGSVWFEHMGVSIQFVKIENQ